MLYVICCILLLVTNLFCAWISKGRTACRSVVAHRDPNNYINKCLPSSKTKNDFCPFQVSNVPISSTLHRKQEEEAAKVI